MAADMVCVAQFEERPPEPRPPLLTLVVDPRFVGSARADDLGLECGDQCSRAVAAGTRTTLTATAGEA